MEDSPGVLFVKQVYCSPDNAVLQDAFHTPGVAPCPSLTAKGPEMHLQAHPVQGSGFSRAPDCPPSVKMRTVAHLIEPISERRVYNWPNELSADSV